MNPFQWFRRDRLDELADEIQSHLDEKTDALMATGMSRGDAEREARRAFGNVTSIKEQGRDVWRLEAFLERVSSDVRYALRGLRQKPAFSLAVVATLALGIGANAVMFALVNAVVLRPLPYPHSERIVSLSQMGDGRDMGALGDHAYDEWLHSQKTVEVAAAFEAIDHVLQSTDGSVRIQGLRATPSYFSVFSARPSIGRLFDSTEALPGGPKVVLLAEALWRTKFRGDSSLLGTTIVLDGVRRLVVGIMPASFTVGRAEQYWIPLRVAPAPPNPSATQGEEAFAYSVVARLRPGATMTAVRGELATIMARRALADPSGEHTSPIVMSLHERRHGESRRPLVLLFAAVGVLLLTACANIVNLSLARAARREREFAVRLALGASRWRIVSFVLIENMMLSAGGTALGLLIVTSTLGWFVRISPGSVSSAHGIGVDGALIAYMSVVAVITALLFGLVPAFTASRATLNQTLSNGTPLAAGSKRQSVARRVLVVGQLAVALVFLTGAGLVAKTFWRVTSIDPGFRPAGLLAADINLRQSRYTAATARAFFEDLIVRVRSLPGVQSVAYAEAAPLGTAGIVEVVSAVSNGDAKRTVARFGVTAVGPEYFQTIGVELVEGRFFTADDRTGAPRVAIVSESHVRTNMGGGPAVGRKRGRPDQATTIVGVVKDVSAGAVDGPRLPVVYTPLAQKKEVMHLQLMMRTAGEPEQLQGPIRQLVQSLDPAQPAPEFTTMERALAKSVAPRRFTLVMLAAFALLAGGLAVIGLYSVLAYLVAERTREIGIRIAIGADARRVTGMILGHGLRLIIVGVLLGGAASIVAVRVLRASMYEMSVYDAPTFVAVAALLIVVALFASWVPARRASRVDPVLALRAE